MIKKVNEEEFEENVLKKSSCIVFFYRNNSELCAKMENVLLQLSNSIKDIGIYKVDADVEFNLIKKYYIMNVPTVMLFKNGHVVDQEIYYKDFYDREILEKMKGYVEIFLK